MKTMGIRKLRSNSRWWQLTKPELSSLQRIGQKTSTAPPLKLEMRASGINRCP
jgi:hypothetical protein